MTHKVLKTVLLLSLLVVCGISNLEAQILPKTEEDSEGNEVQFSILPVLAYSSDTGLIGGIFFQRINYGDTSLPFLSRFRGDLTASLRGEFVSQIIYDHTKTFNTDIRSRMSLLLYKSKVSQYFGLGNNSEFSDDLYEDDYYYYRSKELNFLYRGRKTLADYGFEGKFDVFADLKISYQTANESEGASQFSEDQNGLETDGWVNKIGIGIIADDRDSEFAPTSGYKYEAGYQISHSILGSKYNYSDVWLQFLNYVEVIPNIVVAQKIRGEYSMGNPPFWELPSLGDSDTLRGFHLDRYRGDHSILHILEARTWLFSILDGEIRFGGQLFWDSGRVFTDQDSNKLFDDWKHTVGFGGAISLFSPDFIVRGDIGFSDESMLIYAGVGYIF